MLVTGTIITLISLVLKLPPRTALIAGFGLALSSTDFGLQILQDTGEFGTAYGRSAFAILLLQDLAIVPLIALLPLLVRLSRRLGPTPASAPLAAARPSEPNTYE